MKMITKVFLVIAILIICLIVWVLFLGGGGIIQKGWNGIADSVNKTWIAVTGSNDGVIPYWNANNAQNIGDGVGDVEAGLGAGSNP